MDAIDWMPETEFSENVVTPVCKRPRLYTTDGSFNEVVAFLEGFGLGANVGQASYHSAFTPFHTWLAKSDGRPERSAGWTYFRTRFASDSEAIQNISRLYAEYAASVFEDAT